MNLLRGFAWFACIAFLFAGPARAAETPPKLRVLIFSGQNNHDWRKTTPVLKQVLTTAGFAVEVTEHPEQCNAATFAGFDCIVGNWNNWGVTGGTAKDWPQQTRKDFLEFVRSGHGFVVVHAGGAMFFDWPEFQKLIGGTWGLGTTGHGHIHAFEVKFTVTQHPVTKGLVPFTTTDELWHRMATQPEKKVLATAFSAKEHGGSGQDEPVAMTTEFGRGRCFNLVLGHNAEAMENAGFQTLLVRGVEWAATGKVTDGRLVAEDGKSSGVPALHTVLEFVDEIRIKQSDGQFRSLDSLLKDVGQYKFGDNRASLLTIEQVTLALGAKDEPNRKFLAGKYVSLLAGPATADGKRFVCRQLGLIGGAAEVPALEALLADEQFSFAARAALERIPGDESLAALRRAAGKAKGLTKAGLIQSLGVRRDKKAIPLLEAALKDPDRVVVAAALNTLGRIGAEARMALPDGVQEQVPADLWPQLYQSLLLIAKDFQAHGESDEALWIVSHLDPQSKFAGVRSAAVLASTEWLADDMANEMLITCLEMSDSVVQSAAIRVLQVDSKEGRLKKLSGKFDSLPHAVQLRVVRALADGHQPAALPIVNKAAASKDPAVRQAGLAALGSVGNATSVPVLMEALQSENKDVVKQVEEGLARLRGPGVDAVLVAGLEKSPVTAQRRIIRVLAARSAKEAVPALLAAAESQDAGVRAEAIRALGAVGDAKAGLHVVELLDKTPDRDAVEVALVTIYRNAGTVDPLLDAFRQATGPRKTSLVSVLGFLGGPKAGEAVRAALKTGDAETRRAAVRALAASTDAAPLDDLLAEAASTKNSAIKVLALRGVANLVPLAVDRKAEDRVAVLRKAIAVTDDKDQLKPILAALGKIPCRAAAQLAAGYLKDPGLRDEAALAVVEVAEGLGVQARVQVGAELKEARAVCGNPVIQARLNAIPLGENLALGGKATNPDGLAADGEGGPPQSAIDGNPNTYWDEVDNQKLYQLRVEMKKPAVVATIRIMGFKQHEFAPKDFEVLCDDKVVKQVRDAQYQNNLLTVPLPSTRCTTIQLNITGYYGGSPAIRELEIYGPEE